MAFYFAKLLSLLLVLGAVLGTNAAGQCVVDSEAAKLAPCYEAAQNANAPVSAGCCNAAHKLSTNPACLCSVLLSKTAKAAGIDPAVAITIPQRCQFSDRPVGYKCGGKITPH